MKQAAALGKALEFCALSLRDERCIGKNLRLLKLARRHSCLVSVSSDAQNEEAIGRVEPVLVLLEEAGFPQELVVNASSKQMNAFMAGRGKARIRLS